MFIASLCILSIFQEGESMLGWFVTLDEIILYYSSEIFSQVSI